MFAKVGQELRTLIRVDLLQDAVVHDTSGYQQLGNRLRCMPAHWVGNRPISQIVRYHQNIPLTSESAGVSTESACLCAKHIVVRGHIIEPRRVSQTVTKMELNGFHEGLYFS